MVAFQPVEDPKDTTINTLKKIVNALNVQLTAVNNRLAALEGVRDSELNAGGYEITGVKSGLRTRTSVATRTDLQNRTLYKTSRIGSLTTNSQVVSGKGVISAATAQRGNEVITLDRLTASEWRNGLCLTQENAVTLSNSAWVDVPLLTFDASPLTSYTIDATLLFTTGASSDVFKVSCNGPTSPTAMSFILSLPTASTTIESASVDTYDMCPALSGTLSGTSVARFRGVFTCGSTGGTWVLRSRLTTGSVSGSILAGSTMKVATI